MSLAESCTMGKIASTFAYTAGASNFFKGSIVSYATSSKIDVLKVNADTILAFSVVSSSVAIEMAQNARTLFKTDYALATTGNAGPQTGDADSKIGTVFIALATADHTFVEEFNFGQPREKVIDKTVNKAFEMLLKEISKNI